MNRATIEIRLIRLKRLVDDVNVPKGFTISYGNDDHKHKFRIFKENLDAMEFSIQMLLDGSRGWFTYYNEWYKALSKLYLKQK